MPSSPPNYFPSRERYGNRFVAKCLETATAAARGDVEDETLSSSSLRAMLSAVPPTTTTRLPPREGNYLCCWISDNVQDSATVNLSIETKQIQFGGCEILSDCCSSSHVCRPYIQVHFGPLREEGSDYDYHERDDDSGNDIVVRRPFREAILYTKHQVYQFEHVAPEGNHEDIDLLYPWIKIPESINPQIDQGFSAARMLQHGGRHADVWSMERRDLVQIVRARLDRLARETDDRPIPKYQMILDPNQFTRNDQWVPCEFDISNDGSSVELVGGDRAYYTKPKLVKNVFEPILQASLPLLSKLERPKLLLEGQRLQAVVKAQRILVSPSGDDGASDYVGLWHVDGQHEHVAAVVLFYYRVSPGLVGGSMEFLDRKPVALTHSDTRENPRNKWFLQEKLLDGDHARCIVPVEEGTMLVFSNYQMAHRVLKMANRSAEQASRDFIALFIIDPAARPLVPARCHLAEAYLYQKTLQGIGRDDEKEFVLPKQVLDAVLEYAGIQPSLKIRRQNRNRLLRSQLKPSGEIGVDGRYLVSTGNGCFTMIGWLDSMLAPDNGNHDVSENFHVKALNRVPTSVDRGLSEAFETTSSVLEREMYPMAHFGYSCDRCHQGPIISRVRYHCIAPACNSGDGYDLCQECMDRNQDDGFHGHAFIACYPPSLEDEAPDSDTWGDDRPPVSHGEVITILPELRRRPACIPGGRL